MVDLELHVSKSLLKSEKNTKKLDDYTNRRIYHIVEQVIKPSEIYKRQALFIKTEDLDIKLIKICIQNLNM